MRNCTQLLWVCLFAFDLYAVEVESPHHWAFQPITKPDLPEVKNKAWVWNPIDRFILARLEAKGLPPSPIASEHTLPPYSLLNGYSPTTSVMYDGGYNTEAVSPI